MLQSSPFYANSASRRDEPALHLPRGDVPWWTNGQHEHPPRDEPCDPLSPTCHGHDENADAGSLGKAADDWTRWACTRGVQWACQYPDFGERDLDASPQHAPPTNCGYYNSRECVSAHAHQSPAVREVRWRSLFTRISALRLTSSPD